MQVKCGVCWICVGEWWEKDSTTTQFHHLSQQCMLNAINKFIYLLPALSLSFFVNMSVILFLTHLHTCHPPQDSHSTAWAFHGGSTAVWASSSSSSSTLSIFCFASHTGRLISSSSRSGNPATVVRRPRPNKRRPEGTEAGKW